MVGDYRSSPLRQVITCESSPPKSATKCSARLKAVIAWLRLNSQGWVGQNDPRTVAVRSRAAIS
jgi:hypothetical protein